MAEREGERKGNDVEKRRKKKGKWWKVCVRVCVACKGNEDRKKKKRNRIKGLRSKKRD